MGKVKALLNRLNPRERNLLAAILFSLALLGGKVYVADELVAGLAAAKQAEAIRGEIARSENLLSDLSGRKPASFQASPLFVYRKENNGLGNLLRRLTDSPEAGRFFTVRKITLDKAETLPEFEKSRLELEVEGPFHSIGNFLEQLEDSRFLTRVENVQVFRIEKELRLCRARILVNTYSWREP